MSGIADMFKKSKLPKPISPLGPEVENARRVQKAAALAGTEDAGGTLLGLGGGGGGAGSALAGGAAKSLLGQ